MSISYAILETGVTDMIDHNRRRVVECQRMIESIEDHNDPAYHRLEGKRQAFQMVVQDLEKLMGSMR